MVASWALAVTLLLVYNPRRNWRLPVASVLRLLMPGVLYGTLYAIHASRVQRFWYVDRPEGVRTVGLTDVAIRSLETLMIWAREFTLPSALHFRALPFDRLQKTFVFSWSQPLDLINILIVAALMGILASAIRPRDMNARLPLVLLAAGTAVGYAAVICVGRPQSEVEGIAYYPYEFCLLLTVVVYALIDVSSMRPLKAGVAGLFLVAFITMHATQARGVTRAIGDSDQRASRYFSAVARFADAHRHEEGFTFTIQGRPAGVDPPITLREGYPDESSPRIVVRRMSAIVFARYYSDGHPRYVFDTY